MVGKEKANKMSEDFKRGLNEKVEQIKNSEMANKMGTV